MVASGLSRATQTLDRSRVNVDATIRANAVGSPPGNDGGAFFTSTQADSFFRAAETIGRGGQLGIGKDFSHGVLIAGPARQ